MMITLLIAFAVGIVLGKAMLPVLHKLKFGQNIYELAPEAHKKKQGTPTMGGLVIAGAAIAAALVMNDYSVPMGQNMLLAMLLMALGNLCIGFVFMGSLVKRMFKKNVFTMLGALLCKSGLKNMMSMLDYREIGGTPFLGIRKPVIKAHGSSDALAFRNAIAQAVNAAKNDISADLEQMLAAVKEQSND